MSDEEYTAELDGKGELLSGETFDALINSLGAPPEEITIISHPCQLTAYWRTQRNTHAVPGAEGRPTGRATDDGSLWMQDTKFPRDSIRAESRAGSAILRNLKVPPGM